MAARKSTKKTTARKRTPSRRAPNRPVEVDPAQPSDVEVDEHPTPKQADPSNEARRG